MPHKVNPIYFENAEGNIGIANALLSHFGEKLPVSRFQRDLSDSTVLRATGTAIGHSLLAWKSTMKGLSRVAANPSAIALDLEDAWEVLGEAVQTVMRKHGVTDAYERLKSATRGQSNVTKEMIFAAINNCKELPEADRTALLTLTPSGYIGLASKLVKICDLKPISGGEIMKIRLKDLAAKLGAEVSRATTPSQLEIEISGIASVDRAKKNEVTFLIKPEYMKFAATTEAGAVIVGKEIADCPCPQLIHKNPYWAFAKTSQLFAPERSEAKNISSDAFVSSSARIGRDVTIYPGAYLSDDCVIGDESVIYPGVYVGRRALVGSQTVIRANVVIEDGCVVGDRVLIHAGTVIGADGFGFAPGSDEIAKIPQVGIVRIGSDVEIGALVTIDPRSDG